MVHILIIDDEADAAESLRDLIADDNTSVATAHNLFDARRQISLQQPDIILLDLQLPDGNGMDIFSDPQLLAHSEVILVTGHASLETSIQALRLGAVDYLVKPINPSHLRSVLSRFMKPAVVQSEVAQLNADLAQRGHFGQLWGRSDAMLQVYEQIAKVAVTGVPVFINGESGTGKELVAQAVHDLSRRRKRPFLAINCGAISPQLFESQMFGHEKGSFTGADKQHLGFFERAGGGTLFLDEITEMPLDLQVKLLRVLETGRFTRVGSTTSIDADVRVLAASNRPLQQAVQDGKLREDLLYRLNVFPIELPPLRDRLDDVPLLAEHFLSAISAQEGRIKRFTDKALAQLSKYHWPGNVRELRNAVHRAYVMAPGNTVDERWLPQADAPSPAQATPILRANEDAASMHADGIGMVSFPIGSSMPEIERTAIMATLKHFGNHKERVAAVLGISLKTLYNRLKEYSAEEASER